MDAVTAVSGSGPAYFALLAEAMIEAGILLGLGREISTQLVVQTMLGTAKLLRDEKMHPVELREAVTSPGGTTIAAIRELEQAGVRAAFLNAIQAAMDRSRELAKHGRLVRGGSWRPRTPHTRWVVSPGRETEFVERWSEWADWSRRQGLAAHAMLLRDVDDPHGSSASPVEHASRQSGTGVPGRLPGACHEAT